jgi:FMN phosphatase YigB (HAD superfamily)
VVTNGLADMQLATITGSGIADCVDGWAISGAEQVSKPDVRLFEIAARRCGTSLAGGWMVGDSAVADVGGGQAARLRTIWVDRHRGWPADAARPDHMVGETADAISFLLNR